MAGISPKLPLTVTHSDGTYGLTKSVKEAIIQDLKMILMTNPGEKMMDPSFGVGLRQFLFQKNHASTYNDITSRILSQTKKYLPQIEIEKVLFNESDSNIDASVLMDNNILSMTVRFSIKPLIKIESLTIPLI